MTYTVRVTQYGMGLTYGHATYNVNADNDEEAEAKARQRAGRDGIVVDSVKIISHTHEEGQP